ncbi:unnamed protein product, partial [Rhizoctonia solani]
GDLREALNREAYKQASNKDFRPPNTDPLPPFRHNPLHDVESMWWLCTWAILYFVPSKSPGHVYVENYWKAFTNDQFARQQCISGYRGFLDITTHLSKTASLISPIESWRQKLNTLYTDCYTAHDNSPTPSARICVDDETIRLSHECGKQRLEELKSASEAITGDFVTVAEKYHQSDRNVPSMKTRSREFDIVLPVRNTRGNGTTPSK